MGYNPLYNCHTLVENALESIGGTKQHHNRITSITHLSHFVQKPHLSCTNTFFSPWPAWHLEKFENKNCLGMKKYIIHFGLSGKRM